MLYPTPSTGRPLTFRTTTELQAALANDPSLQQDTGNRLVSIGDRFQYNVSYDLRTVTPLAATNALFEAGPSREAPTVAQMQRLFFPAQPQTQPHGAGMSASGVSRAPVSQTTTAEAQQMRASWVRMRPQWEASRQRPDTGRRRDVWMQMQQEFDAARRGPAPAPVRPDPPPQPTPAPERPAPVRPDPQPTAPLPHQQGRGLQLGDRYRTNTVRLIDAERSRLPIGGITPNTGVRFPAIRLEGAAPGSEFSAIYEPRGASDRGNMVSLNAGAQDLYVGGGTINRQFAETLFGSAHSNDNAFADYHRQLLALPRDARGFTTPDLGRNGSHAAIAGVTHSLCLPGNRGVGSMFIHRFDDDHCPNGNTNNRAMLYIVPPMGSEHNDPNSFLTAVARTAERMVMLVHEYNMRALMAGRETLDRLRVCRFSSGNYACIDPATGLAIDGRRVADAIHWGLKQGSANMQWRDGGLLLKTIEYEDGMKGLFSKTGMHDCDAQR